MMSQGDSQKGPVTFDDVVWKDLQNWEKTFYTDAAKENYQSVTAAGGRLSDAHKERESGGRLETNVGVVCPDCGKAFKSQSTLTIHQRMHTGERPFSCPDCGKSFGHRSTLIRHRSSHCSIKTGKQPINSSGLTLPSGTQRSYKCGICHESFPSPNVLKKHLGSHTGDQRYMCSECGRTFSCNFYLVRHQRTHTGERPFTCPQCNKSFKCSSVLYRHQRTHTGEQPYKCEVCTRGFSQKSSLIIHLRTHTGERPFSCQLCGRSFCSSSALIRHEHSHRQGRNWPAGDNLVNGNTHESPIRLKLPGSFSGHPEDDIAFSAEDAAEWDKEPETNTLHQETSGNEDLEHGKYLGNVG